MISVLILTLDEEVNLAACIASLPWRGDVYVLDSGSTDRTLDVARENGAHPVTRPFTNYADQRNFGLALPFKHDWIVMLDADERMTPELAVEIDSRIKTADDSTAMFRVRRRDMFMGRWLRRSSGYPTWFPRIFRRSRVRVEREINELYIADGTTHQLAGHLNHFPFKKGIDWWFERHNRYSTAEARLLVAGESGRRIRFTDLVSADPSLRRAALKGLSNRMPGRPYLVFFALYIVRLGFLDGRPGYQFACMRLAYELMIDAKASSLRAERDADPAKRLE